MISSFFLARSRMTSVSLRARAASTLLPSSHGDQAFVKTLNKPELFQTTSYINGAFTDSTSSLFEVMNPSNGQTIASCPRDGAAEVLQAVAASKDAFASWKNTTAKQRGAVLVRMADLVDEHKEDLARILTFESGKPLAEARGEVGYANSFYRMYVCVHVCVHVCVCL